MTQNRLNGLETVNISCEMDGILHFINIIHVFADKSQENVSLVYTE